MNSPREAFDVARHVIKGARLQCARIFHLSPPFFHARRQPKKTDISRLIKENVPNRKRNPSNVDFTKKKNDPYVYQNTLPYHPINLP